MERRVSLTILSKSRIEGQESSSQFFTDGIFKYEDDRVTLVYLDSESADEGDRVTSVQIEPHRVVIRRMGDSASYLVLQQGERQLGCYETFGGILEVGLFASVIDSSFTEQGGLVRLCYKIDANTQLVSENELYIKAELLDPSEEVLDVEEELPF